MRKSRGRIITILVSTLFMVAITSYRMTKIVQKEEKKLLEAESVIGRTIWDITLPLDEFIGDLSQVGSYLVYELPEDLNRGDKRTYARRLDNGVQKALDAQDYRPLPDPLFIGLSRQLKKEFHIEREADSDVIAQYNIATRARGISAKLPKTCTDFKTVQRLPQNFFALEGLCIQASSGQEFKRLFVLEIETRRLTYVSGHLPTDTRFIAFTN